MTPSNHKLKLSPTTVGFFSPPPTSFWNSRILTNIFLSSDTLPVPSMTVWLINTKLTIKSLLRVLKGILGQSDRACFIIEYLCVLFISGYLPLPDILIITHVLIAHVTPPALYNGNQQNYPRSYIRFKG